MDLIDVRVRNFRSIESEQHIPIRKSMTLVGPNNSGKTNILRAIQVLFTGYSNSYGYARDSDLTFGVGRARTSITATFDGDPESEPDVYEAIDELHALQGTERKGEKISLNLYFTDTNTPVYSIFPNIKRPTGNTKAAQYSRTHIGLVNRLLGGFSLHYVPSAKSVDDIYNDLLNPFLRRKVSQVIAPHLSDIDASLSEAASALNDELADAQLSDFEASFSLPQQSVEELVSGFDFMISDPQMTPIHEKGMGIQTTALLAAFRWITKQEKEGGKKVLWLLEEPESYLHPYLASNCNSILENLSKDSTVIKTTHSMAFVPQDPEHVSGTLLNEKNRTEVKGYATFSEAVSEIRSALGIRFSDFYNLDFYNVFVEGASDRSLFSWFLELVPESSRAWPYLRRAKFEDFGGVRHLAGFLRATYEFIRQERVCVSVFDGDYAGEKERRGLQGYFGNKDIPFQANRDFVSVRSRFAIEGLFPDQWVKDVYEDHEGWFDSYSVDAAGEVEPFKIKDARKSDFINVMTTRADSEESLEWAERFLVVCDVIDEALGNLASSLYE
ncbi:MULTISPECIES: AAA family ATPase [unclassified Guyparkeria]|uniref:ATP-dependent nuclease n=1 Tax=unclassified Guyparkeria TaxID=2626246 RepID=UPI0009E9EEF8|nr:MULTISPECIES: AAA family ATPase [unclassified Guyparkeria]